MQRARHLLIGLGSAAAAALIIAAPAAAATHTVLEKANEKTVLGFYAALNEADATHSMAMRIQAIAEKYLSPDYIQHAEMFLSVPGPGSARDKLVRLFQTMPPMPGPVVMPKTVAVMAEGDRVILITSREAPDPTSGAHTPVLTWNMFRVANGKLAEHWASMAGGPPPAGNPPPAPAASSVGADGSHP